MKTSTLQYTMPAGLHAIPLTQLDLRPDSEIDEHLLNPPQVSSEKNVWFYWHAGYGNLYPYAKRNIRTWHRRLAPLGWTVRVVDVCESPRGAGHISNFLDTSDRSLFPHAFYKDTIDGEFRGQLTSDLTRFPLLLVHGGIYADVSYLQIGDVDALWNTTVMNPNYPLTSCVTTSVGPTNRPGNLFLERCNQLLLELWASDGGRTNSHGLLRHPLMREAPELRLPKGPGLEIMDGMGKFEELREKLSDYGIQMLVMSLVIGLVDPETNWDGPGYAHKQMFAMDFSEDTALIEIMTGFDGPKAFRLMSLPLPKEGESESPDQVEARTLVENVLRRSFAVKMAHGPFQNIIGKTLGILWKENTGSDDVLGTYAHWLRHGMLYWTQDTLPTAPDYGLRKPFKTGPLLGVTGEELNSAPHSVMDSPHTRVDAESVLV
ncbi:capsule polysaccharide biosynthesis protein [Pseudovirgaria hyperparasitica]|uniref:Capsule polysaccharide biosynthesis protein n=1 Tax=Pseudovirgaria hyperparasitica TaxID=470096 RepID=A0A6A6WK35_9PEZI|nr:capsule polysaccharide biosynthesis protein [Pseudovirgaria hyperparasitica]KAF2762231.1 capsule polysaccharide biosynthesis protein [Pseudovirgaria hyperparasitica]